MTSLTVVTWCISRSSTSFFLLAMLLWIDVTALDDSSVSLATLPWELLLSSATCAGGGIPGGRDRGGWGEDVKAWQGGCGGGLGFAGGIEDVARRMC